MRWEEVHGGNGLNVFSELECYESWKPNPPGWVLGDNHDKHIPPACTQAGPRDLLH